MSATADMVMGSGFQWNTVSKLKLENRCTGYTPPQNVISAVAWTQAQVMNSNSTSSGKETLITAFQHEYAIGIPSNY